jgi:UDP:flavonoid glycosyltransferase YjiC (YdhE family)
VEPIRLLDPAELMGRDEARRELGLRHDRLAVLLQLGSGNNYDYRTARKLALDRLRGSGDVQVAVAHWLIAEQTLDVPDDVMKLSRYPLSRYLKAFDFVISAVGYNSFHEIISAEVPAIFVPNEHPQQDDQLGRARYAERQGFGFCVRTTEVYRLAACIDALLDPAERQRLRDGCAAIEFENGALEAARFIEEMAYGRRIDRP